jgi:predicted nucleotidyltransferase
MTADDFDALPDVAEGLGNRLYNASQKAASLSELFELAKTKRYAMSRIRRMALCAFLGIRSGDCLQALKRAAILASSKHGRKIKTALPLVTGGSDGLHEWLKS